MLECDNPQQILDTLWTQLNCRIVLPVENIRFSSAKSPQYGAFSDRRQYLRCDCHKKAVLVHRERCHAIYMRDVSHSSVGFLHAEQLFPRERVRLYLANGTKVDMTIRRCRRVQAFCYDCGGQIDAEDRLTITAMREFLLQANIPTLKQLASSQ